MKKIFRKLKRRKKFLIKSNNSGFTLIEILIVTVISGMVFTTIYAFYANVVKFNTESRNEVIAAGLAQEGVEILRNRRDQNILRGASVPFNQGLGNTSNCFPTMVSEPSCDGTGGGDIRKNGLVYANSASGNTTPFRRVCSIVSAVDKIEVTCRVSWDSLVLGGPDSRQTEAKSVLTDWYEFTP